MTMTPKQIIDELEGTVGNLPVSIEQEDPEGGILRPWVTQCTLCRKAEVASKNG